MNISLSPKPRSSSITTIKYLEQLKTKPAYEWKKIKHLQKDYSYTFLFCYYWNGIFNNQVHKLRYMDLNSKINLVYSDIEGLKQATSDESRYLNDRLNDLRKLRDYHRLLESDDPEENKLRKSELNLCDKQSEEMSKDDVYKELNELTSSLSRKNDDYLNNIKNEQTTILYKLEEIIHEYHDLMWIANTPMKKFIDNYLIKRNKICNLKNFFKLTEQLPSSYYNNSNENEKVKSDKIRQRYFSRTDNFEEEEEIIQAEQVELTVTPDNIDHLDQKYLKKYILDYNEETNDIDMIYQLGHNHILTNSERELDIYNITSQLATIKDFIKVSVNTNDQLPFKVLLIFCNALLLIGEYLWTTILKDKLNL